MCVCVCVCVCLIPAHKSTVWSVAYSTAFKHVARLEVCVCVYVCVCMQVQIKEGKVQGEYIIRVYILTYYTYMHAYIYTYMHAYIHTCMHTYIQVQIKEGKVRGEYIIRLLTVQGLFAR